MLTVKQASAILANKYLLNQEKQAFNAYSLRDNKGQEIKVDPSLFDNKEFLSKIKNEKGWLQNALDSSVDYIKDIYTGTYSAVPMTGLALFDAASRSDALRLGERIGYGRIDPKHSTIKRHLEEGIRSVLEGKPNALFDEKDQQLLAKLLQDDKGLGQIAADYKNRGGGYSADIKVVEKVPTMLTSQAVRGSPLLDSSGNVVKDLTGNIAINPNKSEVTTTNKSETIEVDKTIKHQINKQKLDELVALGAKQRAEQLSSNKALGNAHNEPRIMRGLFRDYEIPRGPFAGAAGLLRTSAYLSIPVFENYIRSRLQDIQNKRDIMSMINQYRIQ